MGRRERGAVSALGPGRMLFPTSALVLAFSASCARACLPVLPRYALSDRLFLPVCLPVPGIALAPNPLSSLILACSHLVLYTGRITNKL